MTRSERATALLPALLAAATVTSTATKLRLEDMPLGIGELLLATWLFASFFARAVSTGFGWRPTFALRWGGPFLVATFAALVIGIFAARILGVTSGSAYRDAVAWVFVLALVGWFLLEADSGSEVTRFLRWFATFGASSAVLMLVAGAVDRVVGNGSLFWYFGIRLSGWSENPNQLAILLAPLPFLCMHFSRDATPWVKRAWRIGIIATLVCGVATLSDALFFAWGICFGTLALKKWVSQVLGRKRTVASMMMSAVAAPALLLGVLMISAGTVAVIASTALEARVNEGGQAGIRVSLWWHGLEATAQSPLFGWGPGAHSGVDAPFEGQESHNTPVDLATQAGIPVALAFTTLIIAAVVVAVRSRRHLLAFGLIASVLMSLFHNSLRHPIFWLMIFGVMAACSALEGRRISIFASDDRDVARA